MKENKKCFCGGNMRDDGKKYINISDSRLIGANNAFSFEAVQMYVCERCQKIEFYSLRPSAAPTEAEATEQRLYNIYKDTPTAKLEKILKKNDYTDECKTVIRKILAQRG